jgi:hypothetical protein
MDCRISKEFIFGEFGMRFRGIMMLLFLGWGMPLSLLGQATGPDILIDWAAPHYPISPYIYGINWGMEDAGQEAFAAEIKLPLRRWGGNSTTSYNWREDVTNIDADWYFENFFGKGTPGLTLPNGSDFDQFVEKSRGIGCDTLGTIPIIGWTPKRIKACSFSVAKYGAQQKVDQWWTDCGNGVKLDGKTNIVNDPTDAYQQTAPDFMAAWIQHMVGRYGSAVLGGVRLYNLDNEPDWWYATHRDIHPQPASYDDIWEHTVQYAPAVKAADPTAQLVGPVVGGWWSALYSAADWASGWSTNKPGDPWHWDSNPVDRLAHGDIPFAAWYLKKAKEYEQQNGVRIVDYLDIHAYISPDLNSSFFSSYTPDEKTAVRLESTRSLWDPDYQTPGSDFHQPTRLIRLMHEWVEQYYPGTKLATTEYNWGGLDQIDGALAQADILGIFGRERMDLATIWGPPLPGQPGAYAFRLYRNYDGAGGMFGEMAVKAASQDQGKLAVYASHRTTDQKMTVVLVNKTKSSLSSSIQFAGVLLEGTARVFRYSSANLNAIVRESDQPVGLTGFSATFPAYSLTMMEIPIKSNSFRQLPASRWTERMIQSENSQDQRKRDRQ